MILDCCLTGKKIQVWTEKERDGKVRKKEFDLQPYSYLYLHLPDYEEVVEGLESLFRVEECVFSILHQDLEGYKVYCSPLWDVAEKIELETNYRAELYNVDVRLDQRLLAEKPEHSFPTQSDLTTLELEIKGEKNYPSPENRVEEAKVNGETLKGSEKRVLEGMSERVKSLDPDVLLFPHADYWMQLLLEKARDHSLDLGFSRDGYRRLGSKSYFSYGRTHYRPSAYLPVGRILIDTVNSFNYREGGLDGVLVASQLTRVPPNHTSRFTPGTLISSYEVYEALQKGIAVPFRKKDAEDTRKLEEVKQADRGGMMFQPNPGVYEDVYNIDFTSMYPSIIVKHNLSPETLHGVSGKGFLPEVLEPLLDMRIEAKQKKKLDSSYAGMDSILKWMLVTCFGYTGYKNAKFGRIEVHESIIRISRELLLKAKEVAEDLGFRVLHGIVDCLWVQGDNIDELKRRVEEETGLLTDVDHFDWVVFPPMNDGSGAYNHYYGRTQDGLKLRGVAAKTLQ